MTLMERCYHFTTLVQAAHKQYLSIKSRYAKTENDPLGKIHMTFDETMCVLMAALAGRYSVFSDPQSYAYFLPKVIIDHYVGKAFKASVRSGDMLHYNLFVNAINPSPLALCHVAESILRKDYLRWASELTTAGYDPVAVTNNVCLKLYMNKCFDSQGNDIKEVMGEVRKAMKHNYIDGLKQIGVYKKGKKDVAMVEESAEETVSEIIGIGPKRIPVNMIDAIDIPGSHIDIPQENTDDVLADNEVDTELLYMIDSKPLTFWMVVAEIGEHIKGFNADEFSAVVAHSYADNNNCITKKQACENVARAFGLPVATVTSHFYRSMEKVQQMGSRKADALIARLRSNYADAQEENL